MQPLRLHMNTTKSPLIDLFIFSFCALCIGALTSSCAEDDCANSDDPCCGSIDCVSEPPYLCPTSLNVDVLSYFELVSFNGSGNPHQYAGDGLFRGDNARSKLFEMTLFDNYKLSFHVIVNFDQQHRLTSVLIQMQEIDSHISVEWGGERVKEVILEDLPLGIFSIARTPFDAIMWAQPLTEHHPLIEPFVARSLRLSDGPVIEVWPNPMLPPLRSPQDEWTQALLTEHPWLGDDIIRRARVVYEDASSSALSSDWFFNAEDTPSRRARMRSGDGLESVEMFSVSLPGEETLEGVAHYTLNTQGEPTGLELQNAQGEVLLWTTSTESATPDADAPPTAARQVTWIAAPSPQAPPTQTMRLYIDNQDRLVGVHFASDGPTLMNTTAAQSDAFRARIDYISFNRMVLLRDDGLNGSVDSLEVLKTSASGESLYGLRFSPSRCAGSVGIGDWSDTTLAPRALSALRKHPCAPGHPYSGLAYCSEANAIELPPR
jgi:hypothetical protein